MEVRVDGHIQGLKIAVRNHQPWGVVMAEGDGQAVIEPRELHIGRSTEGVRGGRSRVGEFQVLRPKGHAAHIKAGIDRQVQALELAIGNDQAWCFETISVVAKLGAQLGHTAHADAGRSCQRVGVIRSSVGEFQPLGIKLNFTDCDRRVDGQIQIDEIPILNDQPWV